MKAAVGHEDYRVKNAREGKAIYVPGKTDAEIRAAAEIPAPVALTREKALKLADRIEDTTHLLYNAEAICRFLAELLEDGDYRGHLGVSAVLTLAGRALQEAGDDHATDLEHHIRQLREAGKKENAE